MLTNLSIRDVVLIDRLDLVFEGGLGVLTGETGAGKSILLDSVGLALGSRAEARLVRHGSDQASVIAEFDIGPQPRLDALLQEQAIEHDGVLILRRVLGADGRSRAFVNDQPVSVSLLRQIGACLIEIQGQFDQQGLMDSTTHRGLLDSYAGVSKPLDQTRQAHAAWQEARAALAAAQKAMEASKANEEFLRFAVAELAQLAPESGEETTLADERSILQNAGRVSEAVQAALILLDESGAENAVNQAARAIGQVQEKSGNALDAALAALDRASIEIQEATGELNRATALIDGADGRLEMVEERLFALRDVARKHGVSADELDQLLVDLRAQLDAIDSGEMGLADLQMACNETREVYEATAAVLSDARHKAAATLDKGVNGELPPLKLEKARFKTSVGQLSEAEWGPDGWDQVMFLVSTNPGSPAGPLGKIASGGELSRFLLALKVTLAETGGAPTMIFDEVDSGIGGATAAAVGERLAQLAEQRQVLVVTHSPQVAALGRNHWQVAKSQQGEQMVTAVNPLSPDDQLEELARMLSGAEVTDEARAAAQRLVLNAQKN